MMNCPNCGAPLNPYVWRCEYCKAYIWDTSAMDFDDGSPCFVKIKTKEGTITTLAKPHLETVEIYSDDIYCSDTLGSSLFRVATSKHCDMNVRFECQQSDNGSLFCIDTK